MTTTTLHRTCAAALLAASATLAHAVDLRPDAASVQLGVAHHGTSMAGVGVAWDWDFERLRRHALSAHTELMLNHWRAGAFDGGKQSFTQGVLLPSLRLQLGQARSPWFLEAGIGVSWLDRRFDTPERQLSTQWNFYDMLGAGYKFGERGQHELGLRWIHISNAGLKQPNPGQDVLQLRYVARF